MCVKLQENANKFAAGRCFHFIRSFVAFICGVVVLVCWVFKSANKKAHVIKALLYEKI